MPAIHREASGPVFRGTPPTVPTQPRPARLSRLTLFLHVGKTIRLVRAVLGDRRVPFWRKSLFLWACAVLVLAVLVPDVATTVGSIFLPVIGPLVDIPTDAALDWTVAIVAAPWLLRLLPGDVVTEHYLDIFRRTT